MPTEDAYSSGHLVLSYFGTCMCSNVETNLSWTCLVSGLLNFEHPSVLLFCFTNNMFLTRVQQLQIIQAALNLELDQDENHFAQVLVLLRARRRRRRFWVRTWLLKRSEYGQYEHLMKELGKEDTSGFKIFLRMESAMFYELVQRLSLRISN